MATADEIRALAERVMRLEGPCRVLDANICRIIDLPACTKSDRLPDVMVRVIARVEAGGDDGEIPLYTASLDAAMTQGENFLLVAMSDIAADGLPGVCLCSDTSTTPLREHWGIALNQGKDEARQQVLARCYTAAALLARAAQMETEDDANG